MKKCKYEKALRSLVADTVQFIKWLDAEMVKPSTRERGGRIALATNALEKRVEAVRYFTLGETYRKKKAAAGQS